MPLNYKYFVVFFLLFFMFFGNLMAQNKEAKNDTVVIDSSKLHSPKLATLMSACIPGLGQVYNKKYWKAPVIYVGFGIIGYSIIHNSEKYNTYQTAYISRIDGDSTTIDNFPSTSTENLILYKDGYRRYRDLSYIFGVVWYVMNILDATVDAHLFYFNINEDLSLKVRPAYLPLYYKNTSSTIPGLTLSFNIGKLSTNKNNKLKRYL